MKYTQEDMLIHEGEVYVLGDKITTATIQGRNIQATTDERVLDVPKLPRDKFVKPVDVDALAKLCFEELKKLNPKGDMKEFIRLAVNYGYNANEEGFSMHEAKTIWACGVEASGSFQDAVKIVRPLSLPNSIELENDIIVKVNW